MSGAGLRCVRNLPGSGALGLYAGSKGQYCILKWIQSLVLSAYLDLPTLALPSHPALACPLLFRTGEVSDRERAGSIRLNDYGQACWT